MFRFCLFFFFLSVANVHAEYTVGALELINGGIKGELCNETNRPVGEVIVRVIALGFGEREIWRETIAVQGIAGGQCKEFFSRRSTLEKTNKFAFEFITNNHYRMVPVGEAISAIYVKDADISGGQLELEVCNDSSLAVEKSFLTIFGMDRSDVLWDKYVGVENIPGETCKTIERRFHSPSSRPRKYLYALMDGSLLDDVASGEMSKGLVYSNVIAWNNLFKGTICNQGYGSIQNLPILFRALNGKNELMWREDVYLDQLADGECADFSRRILLGQKPTRWLISVLD